ncbi:battenin [Aplysia californica]|uniref:Battenin n=1 Tax=Aplysia californica TaxID=6500 RepID=A0ABM0JHG5_APLCA|nr:battenin [Aplysia californica]XP_005093752.1 battenin [Aplysia californica]
MAALPPPGADSDDDYDVSCRAIARQEKIAYRRNLASFWIFGLCNNFAYVVMLSAAHDILDEEEKSPPNSTFNFTGTTTTEAPVTTTTGSENATYLECNPVSTGAILLADVLPTLFLKLTFPLFLQKIPYSIKISLVSAFALGSFVLVAMAHEIWLSILGVVCASVSCGLGEITFLSLTTFYHKNVVSMWSSGTGGAGVFGALVYAGFTTAGMSPRTSLLIMVTIPVLMMVTYIFLLTKPVVNEKKAEDSDLTKLLLADMKDKQIELTLRQKLVLIPSLFKYMIPLTLVYFAEYFINQGLHELLYYNGEWLSKSEQYRWFQVDYQIGVFISRSSVNIVHIRKLWFLPVLQFANLALLLCQVFYRFIPSIWIIFVIILWEGLLGGAAYVNTFFAMTNELPPEHKEFCIGVASVGDSLGVAAAGAVAIPSHRAICDLKLKM